jgi:hypothetical protein
MATDIAGQDHRQYDSKISMLSACACIIIKGNNVCKIVQEAIISFRGIGIILKKAVNGGGHRNEIMDNPQLQQQSNGNNNKSHDEKATQAYELYL